MSYYMMNGYNGFGAPPSMIMQAAAGYGATPPAFDAGSVWADWASQDNARTMNAANAIRAGMTYLGQSLTPDQSSGEWGPATGQAWKQFLDANGLPASTVWKSPKGATVYGPTKAGIDKMGALIAGGAGGKSQAGMLMGLGVAAVAAVAILALLGKKKGPEHHTTVHAV